MGKFMDDMRWLSCEIRALRNERQDFVRDLRKGVSSMKADFNNARSAMAAETKAVFSDYMTNLKGEVNGLRQEMRDDISGSRMAWSGGFARRPEGNREEGEKTASQKTRTRKRTQLAVG